MKIKIIDTPAEGTWARDCELICLFDCKGFKISYRRGEDDTYWKVRTPAKFSEVELAPNFEVKAEESKGSEMPKPVNLEQSGGLCRYPVRRMR